MKWLQLAVVIAVLLTLLTLAFPSRTEAQANAETVTIPVDGMT